MSNQRISKNATNKIGEYTLQKKFPGYNARQDKTTLDPSFMVAPSQNVLIGTSGRISQVQGFYSDGQYSGVADSGILSNYDFDNFKSNRRNMRAGFMTSAANDGKLQFRYKDASNNITWIDLMTGLTSINMSFCDFVDGTTFMKLCLWVDGSANIYSWNGAVTTILSTTATTATKEGTKTWAQEGFTTTGTITIAGTDYVYTGGSTTTTLTGLTAVPFISAGTEVHQTPITTALSGMTPPTGFSAFNTDFFPTVIGCGRQNQVYLGASDSNNLCISKYGDFSDYSFSAPRLAGEGWLQILDAPPTAFMPNEGGANAYDMWISEGLSTWSVIRASQTVTFDSSGVPSGTIVEPLNHIRLKVSPRQGAVNNRMVAKMRNHIMYIDHNNVANFIGYISYQYVPSITDFSYSIIDDMNSYDFIHGQIYFHKNYIYISVPKSGLIRVYNMTDQTKEQDAQYKAIEDVTAMPWFWESPITYPIAGFYVDEDGILGGHGYVSSDSYILFSGGSFAGQNIHANATFAYDDLGDRTQTKGSNEIWVDGYIKQNTTIDVTINEDLNACETSQTVQIDGADGQIVCFGGSELGAGHSLGQDSLGSRPLGGALTTPTSLPAYFHAIKTYVQNSYYLEQVSFDTNGVDLQWEIISFGTNKRFTTEGNNSITQ